MAYMSKLLVPSSGVLEAFEKQAIPLFKRVQKATEESASLAALRDTLLPKLISGEIRVAGLAKAQKEEFSHA